MPFTIKCDNCGYKVAGEDDETGRNFQKISERFEKNTMGIIPVLCDVCEDGKPIVEFISKEQYDILFKDLDVDEGTLIFVVTPPR